MTSRREDQGSQLALLTHARIVSEALASSEEPDALLSAFATACLGERVDFCAIDLYDSATSTRRVSCALAADLGPLPSALLEPASVRSVATTTEACWSSARALLVASGAGVAADALGLVSFGQALLVVERETVGTVFFGSRREGALEAFVEQMRLTDLVERAAVALRSARLRIAAATANGLRDEFLSIVSHELRTPLSTILGWAKLLREGGLTADRSKNALEVIHRSALAQSQIIDELLDASRVLGGHLTLALEQVSVATIVRETVASFADRAAKKKLTIDLQTSETGTAVLDAARLRQLVRHLLSNAIKFTPQGGRVEVSLTGDDERIVLTVTDSGVGIEPAVLTQVFDRLRQPEGVAPRQHGTMGLGLAMVRRIVDAHQGEALAESGGGGKGATFRITLPRRPSSSSPLPVARVSSLPPPGKDALNGIRVLVVDDQRDVCEFASTALALRGARVTLAGSAAEALAALHGDTFDLLLSDVAMPHEDGVSLVQKALVAQPDLRTVALSALSHPAAIQRAEAAGFERYLVKPMDPSELVRELADLLHTPKAA